MYICMLHFHLCIISCLHLCIIDCICIICHRDVLLSYALHQGKKNGEKCICLGGACIHAFVSSFSPDFSCALLPLVSSPFTSP
jgi:hypothetical protein